MVRTKDTRPTPSPHESCCSRGLCRSLTLLIVGVVYFSANTQGQQPKEGWQAQVRRDADAHHWVDALRLVDQEIARSPNDMDIRAWRARVLTWAGRLTEAEREYNSVLKVETN